MQVMKWKPGSQITKSGWYSGIPIEIYHSPGICEARSNRSRPEPWCPGSRYRVGTRSYAWR